MLVSNLDNASDEIKDELELSNELLGGRYMRTKRNLSQPWLTSKHMVSHLDCTNWCSLSGANLILLHFIELEIKIQHPPPLQ